MSDTQSEAQRRRLGDASGSRFRAFAPRLLRVDEKVIGAATPALALTAASLRAIAQEKKDG